MVSNHVVAPAHLLENLCFLVYLQMSLWHYLKHTEFYLLSLNKAGTWLCLALILVSVLPLQRICMFLVTQKGR